MIVLFPFPFVAARFWPAVKREIAGLWHVLQNPSRSFRVHFAKVPLLSNPALLRPYAWTTAVITSGTRVISVGVRILVIVSFSLFHFRGVDYDTDIFTERLRCLHTYVHIRDSRTDPHSRRTTFAPISLKKYILHELSNLSLCVCRVSCRILQDAYVHRQTTQKSERRLKDSLVNFTTSFKRLRCPEGVYALVFSVRSVCTCMPA